MEQQKIFISYCHQQKNLLDAFLVHLRPLIDEAHLVLWTDQSVAPSDDWDREIQDALCSCQAAVLLVSPEFLNSNYIRNHEIPTLLELRESERIKLTALYLIDSVVDEEACAFEVPSAGITHKIKLTKYQGLNTPDRPITSFEGNEMAREFTEAAKKLNVLWSSIDEHASVERCSSRKELTVRLERSDAGLHAGYYCQGEKIGEAQQPWANLTREFERWNRLGTAAAENERFTGALFEALFGGLDEHKCRAIFARACGRDAADSNASRHPIRLRIYTTDPLLARLPWHQTAWNQEALHKSGWSFELSPFDPADGFPSPPVQIRTPLPLLLILPDAVQQSSELVERHYADLTACLNSIWSDQPVTKPERYARWQVLCDNKPFTAEQIVYFFGSAAADSGRLRLNFTDADSVNLDALKSLWDYSPPKIVFLNICCDPTADWTAAAASLSRAVPLVIVQRFRSDQPIAAQRCALDWLCAVLRDRQDPVFAINTHGLATATAWRHHGEWETIVGQETKPIDKELAKFLLNRHRQRERISKAALDSLHSRQTRVIATVVCGEASDHLHWFHQQIWITLHTDLKPHATVHQREMRFPPGAETHDAIQQAFCQALTEDPQQTLRTILDKQLKRAPRNKRMLLVLHWEPQGSSRGLPFTPTQLHLWEEFCREILARNCPDRLRILCLLPVEVQKEKFDTVQSLLSELPRHHDNKAFKLFDLDPLDRVQEGDLAEFLRREEMHCPAELLDTLPALILLETGGQFDATVAELEQGFPGVWSVLYDRLQAKHPSFHPTEPSAPDQDIIL